MDRTERPSSLIGSSRSVATYALFGFRDAHTPPDGDEDALRFDAPSEAVVAAVSYVAQEPAWRYAAIITGEFATHELEDVPALLQAVSRFAETGQVVVSLATQEIARSAMNSDYGFRLLGSAHVGRRQLWAGQVERLYYVEHPALPVRVRRAALPLNTHRQTAFFGRRREIEDLNALIDLSRLVTVLGITGMGKSSLIHRIVTEVGDRYSDGVAQIDLSVIDDSALVAPSLTRILDAAKLPGEGHLDAVIEFLKPRRFLLAIDNAEHLLSEVRRVVATILEGCPDVAILVGSQRPLRLAGEARFRLGGLDVPVGDKDWQAMHEYDSVALFIDRAQLLDPKYRLTERDAPAIAGICRRLDGNPVAIELAAGKISTFSPRQILTRLTDRLLLLSDTSGHRPERHRSLQATLEWAYEHLGDEAKILLRRLAVFNGGFSAEQALEVCADARLSEGPATDAFEELVDASLAAPLETNVQEKRFRLPETVRLFARRLLLQSEENFRFEARHRVWCAHLCEQAAAGLEGREQGLWLERLDAHMDDIRPLIDRNAAPGGNGALAVRALLGVHLYFILRHFLMDGYRLATTVVDARPCQNAPDLCRVQNLVSFLAGRLGDPEAAREYALRSVVTARRLGDSGAVARARSTLSGIYEDLGDFEKAARHGRGAARDFARLGQDGAYMKSMINLAPLESRLGNAAAAAALLREAGCRLDRHGNPLMRAYLNQNSAHVALIDRDWKEALILVRSALVAFVEAQELHALGTALRNAAYALEGMGEGVTAARFAGANRKLVHQLEQRIRPYEAKEFDALLERLGERIGRAELAREMFVGAESTVDELLIFVNQVISTWYPA